jgi:hypothetical protein
VVERGDRDRRVERCGRFVELVQRDGTNICSGRFRIDREHFVACFGKLSRERAIPGADFEQAHRRCRQVCADEGEQFGGHHRVMGVEADVPRSAS